MRRARIVLLQLLCIVLYASAVAARSQRRTVSSIASNRKVSVVDRPKHAPQPADGIHRKLGTPTPVRHHTLSRALSRCPCKDEMKKKLGAFQASLKATNATTASIDDLVWQYFGGDPIKPEIAFHKEKLPPCAPNTPRARCARDKASWILTFFLKGCSCGGVRRRRWRALRHPRHQEERPLPSPLPQTTTTIASTETEVSSNAGGYGGAAVVIGAASAGTAAVAAYLLQNAFGWYVPPRMRIHGLRHRGSSLPAIPDASPGTGFSDIPGQMETPFSRDLFQTVDIEMFT